MCHRSADGDIHPDIRAVKDDRVHHVGVKNSFKTIQLLQLKGLGLCMFAIAHHLSLVQLRKGHL